MVRILTALLELVKVWSKMSLAKEVLLVIAMLIASAGAALVQVSNWIVP